MGKVNYPNYDSQLEDMKKGLLRFHNKKDLDDYLIARAKDQITGTVYDKVYDLLYNSDLFTNSDELDEYLASGDFECDFDNIDKLITTELLKAIDNIDNGLNHLIRSKNELFQN